MLLKFKTPRDRNGNTYTLTIDTDRRTYDRTRAPWDKSDFIEIRKRDRERLADELEAAGYTREA